MKPRASALFQGPSKSEAYAVRCLVPDLPAASDLMPYLQRIDGNRWYSNFGPLLYEYEQRLTEMTGGACVTLSSGTAALELAIAALDLKLGSRVLVPDFTFPAPVLAVLRCGLTPVLCDVCVREWVLTPEIAAEVTERVDCGLVLPVASFGGMLSTEGWDRFAETTGIPVLIDAAPALGRQKIGRRAHVAYSLHATKPLGIGEGGLFATPDPELAERVRRSSNYGMANGVVARRGGTNAKLSEHAAAVGLAQLDRWPGVSARRDAVWGRYREALAPLAHVRTQAGFEEVAPTLLSVRLSIDAAAASGALGAAGIETRRWYLPPVHEHPPFASLERCGPGGRPDLPVTQEIARHLLGLPFHTRLSDADIAATVAALKGCIE